MKRQDIYYEEIADDEKYLYFKLNENDIAQAHFHRNIEIVFVKEGAQKTVINGVQKVLHEGDIAFSNPLDIHYYEPEHYSLTYVLILGKQYCENFFAQYGNAFENFLPRTAQSEKIFSHLNYFYNNKSNFTDLMLSGYVEYFLGLLESVYPQHTLHKSKTNILVDILYYINNQYTEDITLADIAERFGYSKNYFSALFNRSVGMTFKTYLNRLRLNKAKLLLKNKENKVTNVIGMCGFKSEESYYRAKRLYDTVHMPDTATEKELYYKNKVKLKFSHPTE